MIRKYPYKPIVICLLTCMLIWGFILGGWPGTAMAESNLRSSVVIINSDRSVKKYAMIEEEFTRVLELSTTQIDIARGRKDLDTIGKKLTAARPEIILSIGTKAYMAAHELAPEIPTIFCMGMNWGKYPVTDQTHVISNTLSPLAQLTLFRLFFPKINRIGILYNPRINQNWFAQASKTAKQFHITLTGARLSEKESVDIQLETLLKKVQALWLIPDPLVLKNKSQVMNIFQKSHQMKIPVFSYHPVFSSLGAVFIASADIGTMARQAAETTMKIYNRNEFLPQVQEPAGTRISLNLERIKAYGLHLNPRALSLVNTFLYINDKKDSGGKK